MGDNTGQDGAHKNMWTDRLFKGNVILDIFSENEYGTPSKQIL